MIRGCHDGMRASVKTDDRVYLGWFSVEQSLRLGCILAPLLFNTFFVPNVALAFVRVDSDTVEDIVKIQRGVVQEQE